MKPVKLNQLLFDVTPPCLSFYVRGLVDFEALLPRIEARLQGLPEMRILLEKNRDRIRELLSVQSATHGFFLSPSLEGFLIPQMETDEHFMLGDSFHLRPLLEELFTNPEYALVILGDEDIRLHVGDMRQLELVEMMDYGHSSGRARFYAEMSNVVAWRQMKGLRDGAMTFMQRHHLAQLPVVVAGPKNLLVPFLRFFPHHFGTIPWETGQLEGLSCPQLLNEVRQRKNDVVEIYAGHFRSRLKNLIRAGRLLGQMDQVISAVGQERVTHLLLPEQQRLWGRFDYHTGHYEVLALHQVEGAQDILGLLAQRVVRDGGKIQFLPAHFFPNGSSAMGILRGHNHAHSPVFGMAAHAR